MCPQFHRNSQKRFYVDGATYFITTITDGRHPFFRELLLAELFIRNLWFAKDLKQFALYGYTVLPEHVHLLIQPLAKANISEVMGTLKRNTARDINNILSNKPLIRTIEGGDSNPRLRVGDLPRLPVKDVIKMNYEITKRNHPHLMFDTYAAHFRAVEKIRKRFIRKYRNIHGLPRFRWQESFRDHIIRDEKDYTNHLHYIYNNAIKHNLGAHAEDWRYMWIEGMLEPILP